jgi:hypothetical protein
MSAKGLIQERYQAEDPAVKRGMINDNPTLCHYLFQISQAQGISQIPSDTLSNNIDGIMQAFEGVSDQKHRQATSQKTECYLTPP